MVSNSLMASSGGRTWGCKVHAVYFATISGFPSVKGGSCAGTSGVEDVEGGLSLANAFPVEFGFPDPLTFKEGPEGDGHR